MTIYISGPITGTKDYMQRFAAAEKFIAAKGYTAINPERELAHMNPQTTSWEEYMGECLKLLSTADAVYAMSGWHTSKGAHIEVMVAVEMGKEVYTEGEDFE